MLALRILLLVLAAILGAAIWLGLIKAVFGL